MNPTRAESLIQTLELIPHPEGGHYRETFRSAIQQPGPRGMRAASTAIWFLLQAGQVSRWHRVLADECWHWYEGDALDLVMCEQPGSPIVVHRLGPVGEGVRPQWVVPAHWWQAAMPVGAYALVGCTVAPGFDFADFTLVDPDSAEGTWFRSQADRRLVDGTV
jgi:predicted cupin superfamily sugar epimerase